MARRLLIGGDAWSSGARARRSRRGRGAVCGVEGTAFDSDTPVAYVDQLASEIKNKIITTHNRNLFFSSYLYSLRLSTNVREILVPFELTGDNYLVLLKLTSILFPDVLRIYKI
jgi:hypothetical protein